ncbi:hypothetical protein SPI_03692 [Niveomyces insectorum RCEF 264]|uniref:Uncharacterized protein n=1 Tax=Niveomyces insectorum RCEF 264 TaxID=1081102 RepID=A0A167WA97_9HYPO|nr:hypothetical protein SPI_03692 [Niveomyces insectorum RCEF 264]
MNQNTGNNTADGGSGSQGISDVRQSSSTLTSLDSLAASVTGSDNIPSSVVPPPATHLGTNSQQATTSATPTALALSGSSAGKEAASAKVTDRWSEGTFGQKPDSVADRSSLGSTSYSGTSAEATTAQVAVVKTIHVGGEGKKEDKNEGNVTTGADVTSADMSDLLADVDSKNLELMSSSARRYRENRSKNK